MCNVVPIGVSSAGCRASGGVWLYGGSALLNDLKLLLRLASLFLVANTKIEVLEEGKKRIRKCKIRLLLYTQPRKMVMCPGNRYV